MDATATRPHAPVLDDVFHPAVADWFGRTFAAPTGAQALAWPAIREGQSTLVAAPTGSGKTLTAFLCAIDDLVRDALAHGGALPDETLVVYVSPLKALSNDIHVNLEAPLAGIGESLARLGLPVPDIRTAVRTGDTTQAERAALRKRAPHILVTTPESLYVLLSSKSGRQMLSGVRSVIVDEIHALANSKRGSHLALSLERLDALTGRTLPRIGLSATQKPIDAVARFLVGGSADAPRACAIVDTGHTRQRDLALELPNVPLTPVMATDVWEQVYDRIAQLAGEHRTTLVFVNTRRTAERTARHLAERLGADAVTAHHGSLAKEHRLDAEQRLKRGELKVLVATASLELGIDIGDVDLVCQVGSPRGIAPFLQRVGRSGHHVGGIPKGRLFPLSRDELVECAALLDSVRRGELDTLRIPEAPLDVLAQQIVAEVASTEWNEDALYEAFTRAAPYARLTRERFDAVLKMLAEGFSSRRGVRAAYLHRDVVAGTVRGRRNATMTATTSGGTIPDTADYSVVLEPQGIHVGTVNEDFAVESIAGDIFQLGNQSYRILRVEPGRVRVEDARGQPPTIPFWMGDAPGRSDELSAAVGRLRAHLDALLTEGDATKGNDTETSRLGPAMRWLIDDLQLTPEAARQIVEYLARARAALGTLPTQDTLVMERFFDESGGTQLVIHTPFGSRVNRAWGLALRKRFCRTFNFELQAAATDDAIILSLSLAHSFALDEVWRYLRSSNGEHLLIQALLDAPLFGVRWRWNATTSLALPRFTGGKRTAPQLQRMKSEDLLATVFPDQVACVENLVGEREIPDHPLVAQTIDDCLHDAMDTEGWLALLRRIETGDVTLVTRDLPAPSPLAAEILNAKPYAFLDDAPLEERRTQAVLARRYSDPESADDLGALDADAIEAVRDEAWPLVRDADEMYDALLTLACVSEEEAGAHAGWPAWLAELAARGRATRMTAPGGVALWVPVERLMCMRALRPDAHCEPALDIPAACAAPWEAGAALIDVIRARLTGFGPLSVEAIAQPLGVSRAAASTALAALEHEGYVMRGRFTPGTDIEEWCERHLLARIHRYTVKRLRREIEPVERADFMRFLFHWQHLTPDTRGTGRDALAAAIEQLEGFEAAAGAWEEALLPARVDDYSPLALDELCRSGKLVWGRIGTPARAAGTPVKSTPIVLLPRRDVGAWQALRDPEAQPALSARAAQVRDALAAHGAMFFDALADELRMLPIEVEQALGELVAAGLVSADSYAGLRALLRPSAKRTAAYAARTRRRGTPLGGMDEAGRWSLVQRPPPATDPTPRRTPTVTDPDALEHIAWTLLRRYGVVFWRLLEREADWLPSWRELVRVFQRLEARGEIRGGRFVAGLAGEQFALPEAIPVLREMRRQPGDGEFICVSGADPLNLAGTLFPGDKVPALAGNRVLFRDGVPVASLVAGDFNYAPALESHEQREDARLRLARWR